MADRADWSILLRPAGKRITQALLSGAKSLTEIAAATRLTKASLQPHLQTLVRLGVVSRVERKTESGREVDYLLRGGSLHVEVRADGPAVVAWASPGKPSTFPYVTQVHDPLARLQVQRCVEAIEGYLAGLGPPPDRTIILFGSLARNEATWKSDVDLLVVTNRALAVTEREAVSDLLADLSEDLLYRASVQFTTTTSFVEGRKLVEREAAKDGMILHERTREVGLWEKMERYSNISL